MSTHARVTAQVADVAYEIADVTTGQARVTSQAVGVAYTIGTVTTGQARVTSQFISVIYSLPPVQLASSTLAFSDSVSTGGGNTYNRSLTDTITFTDDAFRAEPPGNTLLLTQEATVQVVLNVTASNSLELADVAVISNVKTLAVTDSLILSQLVGLVFEESVSSTLVLTDATDQARRAVFDLLALSQLAAAEVTVLGGAISNTLVFTDAVAVTQISIISVNDPITFSDSALTSAVFVRSVANFVSLAAFEAAGLNPNDTPLDGDIRDEAQATFERVDLLLQAPCPGIETTIQLPKPLLQDGENLVSQLSQHQSVDGTLYTYVNRLDDRRLDYTFSLTRAKAVELEDFIDRYTGVEIQLTNWKGEVWKVKLVTNPVQFIATRFGAPGGPGTDVSLTFEGRKLFG